MIPSIGHQCSPASGQKTVVLTGGCFQNFRLLKMTIKRLRADELELEVEVFWPYQIPPNNGGIAFGQAVLAATKNGQPRTTKP
jgi:hydrogenase maturation protein HypF